ncbi:MAG: hypothetical protein R3181_00500 [Rubricoccaceae bacterium]|nr:hypothetical protein [Rubricoccaceae bacterium]
MHRLLLLLLLVPGLARPAQAQFFDLFGSLFENVNAVVFYGQAGVLTDNRTLEGTAADFGTTGLGAEVLINLPSVGDTDFELAFGASAVQGFQANEPTLDLRTSIRTLPTVSVYASRLGLPSGSPLIPYFGAGFGFTELWNARGYAPDGTVYPLQAETFELGAVAGTYLNTGPIRGLYVELGYRRREFSSLVWETEQLPPGWPRSADASGIVVNLGWQFFITRGEQEDE